MDPQLQTFIRQAIIGLSVGSYLALIALGYTMVYGIIELINFAHGDLFTFGFLISLTIFQLLNPPQPMTGLWLIVVLPLVTIGTMLLTGALNVTIERIAYKPLRRAPRLAPLITAVGISFALEAIYAYIWGANPINYPRYFPNINLLKDVSPIIRFTTRDILLLGVTIPLMAALWLFVERTKLGKAMRACAQDREAAAMVGIHVDRIIAITFFIGGALAGGVGVIYGLYLGSGRFLMGFEAGLFAFTAAVLGGIGNIRGAVVGAYIIGIVQAMSDLYIGGEWSRIIIFAALILLLVFRPSGILGSTQSVEKV
jgi:branched-chain amino acid transport system permease protein